MTIDDVVTIMRNALYMIVQVSAPLLLVSLVIGLVVSIFQTVTSIQEQTMTFVPKIVCVFLTLMLLGHWILNTISEYITELWGNFAQYIR